KFGLSGLINALSIFLINTALTLQIVPYVSSIKRTSVLFGVLYGYILFKEKNVGKRFFGALIMVLGVVLIILYR
ncbi:MAG: EamA family transporter, partial [Nanoarchaeota archaeon]|nr:EamA family transporter [Nanoarchaeota archaeon]